MLLLRQLSKNLPISQSGDRTGSSQLRLWPLNSQNVRALLEPKSYTTGLKQEDLFKADEPYPTDLIGKLPKPVPRAKSPLRSEITLSDEIQGLSLLEKRNSDDDSEDTHNGKQLQKRGFLQGLSGNTGVITAVAGIVLALGGLWVVRWLMKKKAEEKEREEEERKRLKFKWKPIKWKPVKPFKGQRPPQARDAMARAWHEYKDSEFE